MALALAATLGGLRIASDRVALRTRQETQFVDVTELVGERVRRAGIAQGLINVQVAHTTAGLVVNENEPLLLADLRRTLERLAPSELRYAHDDLERRGPGLPEDERPNGRAHCRALLLSASVTLQVDAGALSLGRWQRVFLVELDGPRRRVLSTLVLGVEAARSRAGPASADDARAAAPEAHEALQAVGHPVLQAEE